MVCWNVDQNLQFSFMKKLHVLPLYLCTYTTSEIKASSYLNNKFMNINWHLNICIVIYSVFEQEAYHPSRPSSHCSSSQSLLLSWERNVALVHLFVALLLHGRLQPGFLLSDGHFHQGTFSYSQCVCDNHRSCRMADPLVWGGLGCPALKVLIVA